MGEVIGFTCMGGAAPFLGVWDSSVSTKTRPGWKGDGFEERVVAIPRAEVNFAVPHAFEPR